MLASGFRDLYRGAISFDCVEWGNPDASIRATVSLNPIEIKLRFFALAVEL